MRIKVYGKTADAFSMRVKDNENNTLLDYNNYPPTGFGISRDGDSIELSIDNDTGTIIGWVPMTQEKIEELKNN